jgi:hypothetical protein
VGYGGMIMSNIKMYLKEVGGRRILECFLEKQVGR